MDSQKQMEKRIKIITGHYGSGKTEFAVNYAVYRSGTEKNIVLADIDIINPFFRSREKIDLLSSKGVRVIASSLGKKISSDLPALDPQLFSVFEDESIQCVVDTGGDPVGAKVLGYFNKRMRYNNYDMWMVVNANRPETQSVEHVCDLIKRIEETSGFKMNGLINNTHLIKETTSEDVICGNRLCVETEQRTGIPIVFNCLNKYVLNTFKGTIEGHIFPLEIYLRQKWM